MHMQPVLGEMLAEMVEVRHQSRSKKPRGTTNLEGTEMKQEIDRLRASKEQAAKEDRASGAESGRAWAVQKASWRELCAVVALHRPHRNFDDLTELLVDHFGYDLGDFMSLLPDCSETRSPMSDETIEGFVEGAKQVIDEA